MGLFVYLTKKNQIRNQSSGPGPAAVEFILNWSLDKTKNPGVLVQDLKFYILHSEWHPPRCFAPFSQ